MTHRNLRRRLMLAATAVTPALSGCALVGGGEHADPRATITITNETDYNIVHLVTPARSTAVEEYVDGFPRLRARPPGREYSIALVPVDEDYDRRPLCEQANHYFYGVIDPAMEWEPWDDPTQGFADLVLVDVIESPCWDSERPRYSIVDG